MRAFTGANGALSLRIRLNSNTRNSRRFVKFAPNSIRTVFFETSSLMKHWRFEWRGFHRNGAEIVQLERHKQSSGSGNTYSETVHVRTYDSLLSMLIPRIPGNPLSPFSAIAIYQPEDNAQWTKEQIKRQYRSAAIFA